ncbi:hypothetical protein [Longibacter salinarum]|nr:hypothetical protein [Longibacter salinarum]
MSSSYRGFEISPAIDDADTDVQTVSASRGRITLRVHLSEGPMPEGWTLEDVLRFEIDRLIDPKTMRGVKRLN